MEGGSVTRVEDVNLDSGGVGGFLQKCGLGSGGKERRHTLACASLLHARQGWLT